MKNQLKSAVISVFAIALLFTSCGGDSGGGSGGGTDTTDPSDTSDYTSANIGTLKYVPAGSFLRDAGPANKSTQSAFRMSKYEITQAQYMAVTGAANLSTYPGAGDSRPVGNVTWYDAVEFCNDLSTKEGLTPVYNITDRDPSGTNHPIVSATVVIASFYSTGYRLPTEMEWMLAAMGATSDGKIGDIVGGVNTGGYSKAFSGSNGSNAIGDYGWYDANRTSDSSFPVGTKLPNELGLYDMTGNVSEWCWDWYKDSPLSVITGSQSDYIGPDSGTYRVLRGGSFGSPASYAAVAYQGLNFPDTQSGTTGFRVVRP